MKSHLKKIAGAHYTQFAPDAWLKITEMAEAFDESAAASTSDVELIAASFEAVKAAAASNCYTSTYNACVDFLSEDQIMPFMETFSKASPASGAFPAIDEDEKCAVLATEIEKKSAEIGHRFLFF